ncbi:MAG: ribonuclease HII [Anaerolineales bacterium]|nr:ribonuclease HII [Anaerolineales bacterium]
MTFDLRSAIFCPPSSALPNLDKEIALREQGFRFIAGLDEVGRGAWAGPVVAAAVMLPLDRPDLAVVLTGLDDSKKLRPNQRERFFELVHEVALAVGVGLVSAERVDKLNVLEATRQAMQQALSTLKVLPDYLLLDHVRLPAVALPQDAFPKADRLSLTVAAASVVAKVTRDRLMVQYNGEYPGYAFDRHKGYGTAAHQVALAELGPCPLHRMSYRPVAACHQLIPCPG